MQHRYFKKLEKIFLILSIISIIVLEKIGAIFLYTVSMTFCGAFLVALLGFFVARYVFYSKQKFLEIAIILPAYIPSIVAIVGVLKFFNVIFQTGNFSIASDVILIFVIFFSYIANSFMPIFVFFNSMSDSIFKVAENLRFSSYEFLRNIEIPMMKNEIFKIFIIVFFMIFNSFNIWFVAGSCSHCSLQMMIYNSFILASRDMYILVFLQILVNILLVDLIKNFFNDNQSISAEEAPIKDFALTKNIFLQNKLTGFLGKIPIAIILLPIFYSLFNFSIPNFKAEICHVIYNSFIIGGFCGIITTFLSYVIIYFKLQRISFNLLILTPFIFAILLFNYSLFLSIWGKILLISFVISVSKIPFCVITMNVAFREKIAPYQKTISILRLNFFKATRYVMFSILKKTIVKIFLFAFLISFGDLGSVMILGHGEVETIATHVYSAMCAYDFKTIEFFLPILIVFGILIMSISKCLEKENN